MWYVKCGNLPLSFPYPLPRNKCGKTSLQSTPGNSWSHIFNVGNIPALEFTASIALNFSTSLSTEYIFNQNTSSLQATAENFEKVKFSKVSKLNV